jgi:hypothetical protein
MAFFISKNQCCRHHYIKRYPFTSTQSFSAAQILTILLFNPENKAPLLPLVTKGFNK